MSGESGSMRAELLVNATPRETRVVLIEDGVVQEIHIEHCSKRGMVGNIYAGRVMRVLPGLQAAFVDIGMERNSFLPVPELAAVRDRGGAAHPHPAQLREGAKVIVQVTREPTGSKGARLATELSLSTRFLVLLPQARHIGVSQQIRDVDERKRLQQLLEQAVLEEGMDDSLGFILRTAAEGATAQDIAADLRYLARAWSEVARRASAATRPALLYEDLPLPLRTVRDLARPGVQRILVDSEASFATLATFCASYVPDTAAKLQLYRGESPLFELHGVEAELRTALQRRVDLPSGGYLVIDQAEAMTTIDVNTGSFVGRSSHADTILSTNLEAAAALARQLRLRNIGGIIIIDFIDMDTSAHREQVQHALQAALQRDPARCQVSSVSALGLVEMTRKRNRESLQHLLCQPCPECGGGGYVKSAETVCHEIMRAILREANRRHPAALLVIAAPAVVELLQQDGPADLSAQALLPGNSIRLRAEPAYRREQFDVVSL